MLIFQINIKAQNNLDSVKHYAKFEAFAMYGSVGSLFSTQKSFFPSSRVSRLNSNFGALTLGGSYRKNKNKLSFMASYNDSFLEYSSACSFFCSSSFSSSVLYWQRIKTLIYVLRYERYYSLRKRQKYAWDFSYHFGLGTGTRKAWTYNRTNGNPDSFNQDNITAGTMGVGLHYYRKSFRIFTEIGISSTGFVAAGCACKLK